MRAAKQDVQQDFSDIVDHFIRRYCRIGNGLSISDRELFTAFRAFWMASGSLAKSCPVGFRSVPPVRLLESICNATLLGN